MALRGTPKIPKNQVRSITAIHQDEHCDEADARRSKLVDEIGNPINSGNPLPVDAIINLTASKAKTQEIFQVNVNAATTEFSQALPEGTEIIIMSIQLKSGNHRALRLQYTFNTGESGTNFKTLKSGVTRKLEGLSLIDSDRTLYFQLNNIETGGTIVEIETWRP